MNQMLTLPTFRAASFALLGSIAIGLAPSTALAQQQERRESRNDSVRIVDGQALVRVHSKIVKDGRTIEIIRENDSISASVDGEPVPAGRIVTEGNTTYVLDADGNRLHGFNIGAVVPADAPRGRIGVTLAPVDPDLAQARGLAAGEGVLILDVIPDAPADKAGVKAGDIVIAIDGRRPVDTDMLREVVGGSEPGAELTLTLKRGDAILEQSVTVGAPAAQFTFHGPVRIGLGDQLGDVQFQWQDGVQLNMLPDQFRHMIELDDLNDIRLRARQLIEPRAEAFRDMAEQLQRQFDDPRFNVDIMLQEALDNTRVLRPMLIDESFMTQLREKVLQQLEEIDPEIFEQAGQTVRQALDQAMQQMRSVEGRLQQTEEILRNRVAPMQIQIHRAPDGQTLVIPRQQPQQVTVTEVPRAMRAVPATPPTVPTHQTAERLQALEARLERLERLLERLVEQRD